MRRYGRNQKRQHREAIAEAEARAATLWNAIIFFGNALGIYSSDPDLMVAEVHRLLDLKEKNKVLRDKNFLLMLKITNLKDELAAK
ncbi:MAG TPA: hypothetical protein VF795_00875 [Desulfuromonadaceae bacterium]